MRTGIVAMQALRESLVNAMPSALAKLVHRQRVLRAVRSEWNGNILTNPGNWLPISH